MNEIAELASKVLNQSAYLSIKGVSKNALDLIAYKIEEHILANFKVEKKKAWFGIDIEQKIKDKKQELAILYSYKKKLEEPDLFRKGE